MTGPSRTRRLTEEQEALRDLAQSLFRGRSTPQSDHPDATTERDARWAEVVDSDLATLLVGAPLGSGRSIDDLCLVLEQQGRHLVDIPLWATAISLHLLSQDPADLGLLETMAETIGSEHAHVTIADEEPDGALTVDADGSASGRRRLSGRRLHVPHAERARWIVLPETVDGAEALLLIDTADTEPDRIRIEPVATTGLTDRSILHLDRTPARIIARAIDGPGWLRDHRDLCLTALQLGLAREALRIAGDYVGQRHQFGRPIGTFQAISQQVADCHIELSAIDVLLRAAQEELRRGHDATATILAARWSSSDRGVAICQRAVRFHGGYGVDLESTIHRHLLQSLDYAIVGGDPERQLERLADLVPSEERVRFEGN